MRTKVTIKQIKRRVAKLEEKAGISAEANLLREWRALLKFASSAEIHEVVDASKACGHLLAPGSNRDSKSIKEATLNFQRASSKIALRAPQRRERYPLLWQAFNKDEDKNRFPPVAEPWSIDTEIEALTNWVALKWETNVGLAVILERLTPDDLTLMEHLLYSWRRFGVYWNRVCAIATPNDIEQVFTKVLLDSRAVKHEPGKVSSWEYIGRPLTWTDLPLDPATFPWNERNQASGYISWWRKRSMQGNSPVVDASGGNEQPQ